MHKNFEHAGDVPQNAADQLRDKAEQCRRLAKGVADRQTALGLNALADEYEREAGRSAAPKST
jgi:hypothetical protein